MCVEISRGVLSLRWRGLYSPDGVHRMLESKTGHSIDMVFLFLCAFVERATEYKEDKEQM